MTPVAAERVAAFLATLETAFGDETLVGLKLGGYQGPIEDLKGAEARRVVLKSGPVLSVNWRHARRDETKNYALAEALALLAPQVGETFRSARLTLIGRELLLERQGDKVRVRETTVSAEAPSGGHDRDKARPVRPGASWMRTLGLTDASGRVLASAQDKFRQINRMVEILAPLIQRVSGETVEIADMGAGKGYLTFALYQHLTETGRTVRLRGIELREGLVKAGNAMAREAGYDGLVFETGSIIEADVSSADVVIALHACDTATDDALFKAARGGARLIAVAPCCHKQVRRDLDAGALAPGLAPLLSHGIFLERQAEMVTDGLRAQLLETEGYRTRVFEFVADAHTPKNVLIVAERDGRVDRDAARAGVAATKAQFGVVRHHLEELFGQ